MRTDVTTFDTNAHRVGAYLLYRPRAGEDAESKLEQQSSELAVTSASSVRAVKNPVTGESHLNRRVQIALLRGPR